MFNLDVEEIQIQAEKCQKELIKLKRQLKLFSLSSESESQQIKALLKQHLPSDLANICFFYFGSDFPHRFWHREVKAGKKKEYSNLLTICVWIEKEWGASHWVIHVSSDHHEARFAELQQMIGPFKSVVERDMFLCEIKKTFRTVFPGSQSKESVWNYFWQCFNSCSSNGVSLTMIEQANKKILQLQRTAKQLPSLL